MRRDWSLLLCLLSHIEAETLDAFLRDGNAGVQWIENQLISEHHRQEEEQRKTNRVVLLHLKMLIDGGYVDGVRVNRGADGCLAVAVSGDVLLTSDGYDLLEALRNQGFWNRVKKAAQEKAVPLTIETLKDLIGFVVKATLN